jgi:hypothetical protein
MLIRALMSLRCLFIFFHCLDFHAIFSFSLPLLSFLSIVFVWLVLFGSRPKQKGHLLNPIDLGWPK